MLPFSPSASRRLVVALVTVLIAVHAWLAVRATIDLGVTADETAHLTAGYSYWTLDDYRLQPENGNLPQRWAALPLLPQHPHLDPAGQRDAWNRSNVWLISQRFFFESGNSIDFLLLTARSAMVLWSVATGLLVFGWSRRLWGTRGALLSLILYAFSPTTLAHAPLVTSDMCATVCLLAATGAWWRAIQRLEGKWLLASLAAAGLAAVAKFSCVLLLPIAAALAVWRIWSTEPLTLPATFGPNRVIGSRSGKLAVLASLGLAHVLFAAFVVWAFFGFRYSAFSPQAPEGLKFFAAWEKIVPEHGFWHWFFANARAWHLLPEAYLQGFAFVLSAAEERGAFLAGQFSVRGWWWFFPYAFLVKSSLAELAAAAMVLVLAGIRLLRGKVLRALTRFAPLLVFAVVYGGFSLASNLNIGHRHILPLYPVLFIFAGALLRGSLNRSKIAAAALLGGLAVAEVAATTPHYLAYFNRLAGGPANGWRLLVDSSLDWGQNLPRLADWLREHRRPGEKVYVTMFGSDDPFYEGVNAIELAPTYSFGRQRRWVELAPGLYCISATMLQDVYSPYAGPWTLEHEIAYRKLLRMMRAELAAGERPPNLGEFGHGPERPLWNLDRARFARLCLYLRERKPEAVIGHTIFVYRLSAEEVRVVVEGTLSELANAMAAKMEGARQGN